MKTEITTDKEKHSFQAKREFAASPELVWKAWTTTELLDKWWAPRPWKCETKSMDFREGGQWLYDMVGPAGERHGGTQRYKEISLHKYFSGTDAFVDPQGNVIEAMPVAKWKNTFIPTEKGTMVVTLSEYPSAEALETVLKMGMAEGFNMALDNLEELLTSK